jgi:hypothetical protein
LCDVICVGCVDIMQLCIIVVQNVL